VFYQKVESDQALLIDVYEISITIRLPSDRMTAAPPFVATGTSSLILPDEVNGWRIT
jgi:hypothetical protein